MVAPWAAWRQRARPNLSAPLVGSGHRSGLAASFSCTSDPNDPGTWVAKLDSKNTHVVADALGHLRTLKAKSAVPQILAQLKSDDGEVREAAAAALEDIGDPSAVPGLADAVDFASSDKAVVRANMRITDALGTLGGDAATPTLLKVLHASDELLRTHAVQALAKTHDPRASAELIQVVQNRDTHRFVEKFAIMALGDLRAKEAVPALTKALVMEKDGASFFSEASYALFQIGTPAVPVLVSIVDQTGKEYLDWAASENRLLAGFIAKACIVLADIGDPAAIPALTKALKYEDEQHSLQNLVRGKAAEALGRLRANTAAGAIASALPSVDDANMRAEVAVALTHVGDKSVLPKLEAAVKDTKDTWTDREETIKALGLLGDSKETAMLEAVQKAETSDKARKDCIAIMTDEPGGQTAETTCKKAIDERSKLITDEIKLLATGDACQDNVTCWIGKLKDQSPSVRERAAYTLGKLESVAAIDPLLTACKDESSFVRRAAYIALDWLTRVDAAKPILKAKAEVLSAQYQAEKEQATWAKVNEDLRRVVWKTQHL